MCTLFANPLKLVYRSPGDTAKSTERLRTVYLEFIRKARNFVRRMIYSACDRKNEQARENVQSKNGSRLYHRDVAD